MRLTRRHLFRSGAALGGAAVVSGQSTSASSAASSLTVKAGSGLATLGGVLRRGTKGRGGYAKIVRKPGERHVLRTGLGVRPQRGRVRRRKPLIAFAQLSDVHVIDAQSPLRVEWTDRFDDPSPLPATGIFASAYRPHEMLSGHIADAMVREINRIGRGPVTGKPLALAIQTGDNSDNSQLNEVRWNIDLLDGKRVRIDSGDLTTYEGVCDSNPTYYDTHYWHPDGAPVGKPADAARTVFGFPRVPGLLDAARRPFQAAGLNMPWYAAFGNHDGLAQGNFPASLQISAIAVGPLKIISPPAGINQHDVLEALSGDFAGFVAALTLTPAARMVTPDTRRRLLNRGQIVDEHFRTSGTPRGHGFTAANRRDNTAYYSFDRGVMRFIVLDTVNPNGYANGSIDQAQFAWLTALLARSARKIVIVCSHHTSDTMDNPLLATGGDPEPRVMGPAVLALLLDNHHVVAWINGHTHRNAIRAHRRPTGGGAADGGLWEINTAAHIDWPQQSRLIEITDNVDGTLSIFTTVVDHAGPASYGGKLSDSVSLASLGRELAANDWHNRSDAGLGKRTDRNTELVVRMPPGVQL